MNPARQASAKNMVTREMVLSFTPRTGLISLPGSVVFVALSAATHVLILRGIFLFELLRACAMLLPSVRKTQLQLRRSP